MDARYIGVDIGGTKCAVLLGEAEGESLRVVEKEVIPTDHSAGPQAMLERIELIIGEYLRRGDAEGIGVSCGGPLDSERGVILSPPNLPGWDSVAIKELFETRFHLRTMLQNDANACAYAEWRYGAGRGTRDMVFCTMGTGLGAGLILDGKLYCGANGNAGELGHIRLDRLGPVGYGKSGSFEGFCSGGGLAQIGRTLALERIQANRPPAYCPNMGELEGISALTLALAAEAGDETAIEAYRICGERLGQGLAMVIDMLNPEAIVIGSIFARSRRLLVEAMEAAIEREALLPSRSVCRILPAALGEALGDIAALSTALI